MIQTWELLRGLISSSCITSQQLNLLFMGIVKLLATSWHVRNDSKSSGLVESAFPSYAWSAWARVVHFTVTVRPHWAWTVARILFLLWKLHHWSFRTVYLVLSILYRHYSLNSDHTPWERFMFSVKIDRLTLLCRQIIAGVNSPRPMKGLAGTVSTGRSKVFYKVLPDGDWEKYPLYG